MSSSNKGSSSPIENKTSESPPSFIKTKSTLSVKSSKSIRTNTRQSDTDRRTNLTDYGDVDGECDGLSDDVFDCNMNSSISPILPSPQPTKAKTPPTPPVTIINNGLIKKPTRIDFSKLFSSEPTPLKPEKSDPELRVRRFLSIVDIPDEAKEYMRNAGLYNNTINETDEYDEDEDDDDDESNMVYIKPHTNTATTTVTLTAVGDKCTKAKLKRDNTCGSKKTSRTRIRSYHDGTGIPQNVKMNIIRTILKDYNVETFVDKFTACDVVEVKLESHDRKWKPIRDRLMRLMNSDVIKFNDPKYMQLLTTRVEESIVEENFKVIEYLEEKERQREKKLKLQGLLEHLPNLEHNKQLDACLRRHAKKKLIL